MQQFIILFLICISQQRDQHLSDTVRLFQRMNFTAAGRFVPQKDQIAVQKKLNSLNENLSRLYAPPATTLISSHGCILEEDTYPHNGSETAASPFIADLSFWFHDIIEWKNDQPVFNKDDYSVYMRIQCNRIGYFLEKANGCKNIFMTPEQNESIKGYPKYNQVIVMMKKDRGLPWRPCSRQEYLQDMIANNSVQRIKQKATQYLQQMNTGEKILPAILKVVNGTVQYFEYDSWNGFANSNNPSAKALVTINEEYYDVNLPKSSIQLIAISRNYLSHGRSLHISKEEYLRQIRRVNAMLYAPGVFEAIERLMEP